MRWDDRSKESRWREEDLDEYEEEDGEGYEEEEEEEEEEEPKLTQEEMEYLKRRERMKEKIRQQHRRESSSSHGRSAASSDRHRASTHSEFGSFFGPARPVIARRVIEESNSVRETQHLSSKTPKSYSDNKRAPTSANGERKIIRAPKVINPLKSKVERLKDTRDYSFLLSDDNDLPAPPRDPASRTTHAPSSNALSAQTQERARMPATKPHRPVSGATDDVRRRSSSTQQVQSRGLVKVPPESRMKTSTGSGPGRPPLQKTISNTSQSVGLKRSSAITTIKQNPERKSIGMRPDSSSKQQHYEQRRYLPESRSMAPPRQSSSTGNVHQRPTRQVLNSSKPQKLVSSSKPQQIAHSSRPHQSSNPQWAPYSSAARTQKTDYLSKPLQKNHAPKPTEQSYISKSEQRGHTLEPQRSKPSKHSSHRMPSPTGRSLKRKPPRNPYDDDDDSADAVSMIRKMFGYNPNRYEDDDDDSDMEANFDDIMREERRSSKIAQMEDEEQARLIEEEEKQERMRKLAKKRRLG